MSQKLGILLLASLLMSYVGLAGADNNHYNPQPEKHVTDSDTPSDQTDLSQQQPIDTDETMPQDDEDDSQYGTDNDYD